MKVLVIGSGAREHALIWKLSQNPKIEKIYCVPGNPGITEYAECVNISLDDISALCEFVMENGIDFTIPMTQRVIAKGICDVFRANGLMIFGPNEEAAKIGTNRAFAKKFMYKNKIPTPRYGLFDKESVAIDYIKKANYPIIVKYDVVDVYTEDAFYCETFAQARKVVEKSFENMNKTVVIEEFFKGYEVTFTVLTDGYNAVPLPYACVYKRVLDAEGGAMAQGVGAFAPVSKIDYEIESKIAQEIVYPVIDALASAGTPFEGFLSFDMIISETNEVKAIGFSSTIGDPEAQTVLPLIEDDIFDLLYITAIGALADEYESIVTNDQNAISVSLLSGSGPSNPKRNKVIEGIEEIDDDDLLLFYGDTAMNSYYEVVTNGHRPLTFTSTASTLNNAYDKVYENIDMVTFDGKRYRKDIAKSFLSDKKVFL